MNLRLVPFTTLQFGTKFLLISARSNMYFVCDQSLYDRIITDRIDEDLAMKLFQLGLAEIDGATSSQTKPVEGIRPTFFLIDVTTNCNLNCVYCFRNIRDGVIDDSNLRCILDYIYKYCQESGVNRISLQPWGGEPLLAYDRILTMFEFFSSRSIQCNLTFQTNGTKLTPAMAKELRSMGARIGLSIDGLEQTHNLSRPFRGGQDSYKAVMRGLSYLIEAGYQLHEIGTILVLNRFNVEYLEEIIDYYAKILQFRSIKVNYTVENPNMENSSICITPQEYAAAQLRVLEKVINLRSEGYIINEENVRIKARNILFGTRGDICRSSGCQGGFQMIAFDRHGGIYPCDVTDEPALRIGNVSDGLSLVEVIDRASKNHLFFRNTEDQKCHNCPWYSYCRGGCHSARYYTTGTINGYDAFECESNHTLYPRLFDMFLNSQERTALFG